MSLEVVCPSSDEEDEIAGDIPWKRQPRVGDSSTSSPPISSRGQVVGFEALDAVGKVAGATDVESSMKEGSNHPSAMKAVFKRLRVEFDGSVAKKRWVDFKAPSLPPPLPPSPLLQLPSPLASSSSYSQSQSRRWSESAIDTLNKNQRKRQRKKRRKRASLSIMNTLPSDSVAAREQQQLGESSSSVIGGFGGRCSLAFYDTSSTVALNISPDESFIASQEPPCDAVIAVDMDLRSEDVVDKGLEAKDSFDKGLEAENSFDKGLEAEYDGLDVEDEVVFIKAYTNTRVCTGEVVIDDDDNADDCQGNDASGNENDQINDQGGSRNGSNDDNNNNTDDESKNNGDSNNDNNNNGVKIIVTPATEEVMIEEYIFEEYRTVYFEVSPTMEKAIDDDDFWMAFSQFGTVEKLRLEADKGMIVFKSILAVEICLKERTMTVNDVVLSLRRLPEKLDPVTHDPSIVQISGIFHLSRATLAGYFSSFGAVEQVVILPSRGFAFVTFCSSDSVEKVLLQRFHPIQGLVVETRSAKRRSPDPPPPPHHPPPRPVHFDVGPRGRLRPGETFVIRPFPRKVTMKVEMKKEEEKPVQFHGHLPFPSKPFTVKTENV